jgi:hypothetical protein
MLCPSCKVETRIQEVKTVYIYPSKFFGLPAFWGFISPAVARLVTVTIAILGLVMAAVGVGALMVGRLAMGVVPLLIFAFCVYSAAVCINSLGKYQVKRYFRCLSCRLDWYEFVEK